MLLPTVFNLRGSRLRHTNSLLTLAALVPCILGEFAIQYEEVGRGYEVMFFCLWNRLRMTDELPKFLLPLEERDDRGRASRENQRVWELMKGLCSP